MPVTRRRRANPPEQPEENNNNHQVDSPENAAETPATERPAEVPTPEEPAAAATPTSAAEETVTPVPPAIPPTPVRAENVSYQPFASAPTVPPAAINGDRIDRVERQEYTPTIEGGRRTARGELFRRPPQPPAAQMPPPMAAPQLQAPTHEISLPLGNLLHLAYNPSYTGAEEARSALLQQLASESKAGGRARCWSCGSLAIVYDRWNTRSRTFGEVGVAFCEICGVWSVM